jgi:hypothetical protein
VVNEFADVRERDNLNIHPETRNIGLFNYNSKRGFATKLSEKSPQKSRLKKSESEQKITADTY